MAEIEVVLQGAREDLITVPYAINSVIKGKKYKAHKKNTLIRDNPGRARLFDVELSETATGDWFIGSSTYTDMEMHFNYVIGFPHGDDYTVAAISEFRKILNNVTFRAGPVGVQFYQITDDPYWEEEEDFRWLIIPVLCRIETTG